MKALVATLSTEQLAKLNAWNFLVMGSMTFYSFITMFWAAQIVSKTKNPFIAFFQSIKFTFKHFLPSLLIFIYISLINFTVSLINAFAMVNPIIYFISMLVYFYFVVYIVVLIFLYYDGENYKRIEEKTENKCQQSDSSKDSGNIGPDSVGQDEIRDSKSEGD